MSELVDGNVYVSLRNKLPDILSHDISICKMDIQHHTCVLYKVHFHLQLGT